MRNKELIELALTAASELYKREDLQDCRLREHALKELTKALKPKKINSKMVNMSATVLWTEMVESLRLDGWAPPDKVHAGPNTSTYIREVAKLYILGSEITDE
jgi:hypothetical protein